MVKITALILTRDNSRTIKNCILALKNAVDEIIVVDTGSTDDTVQTAESLGAHVHHFQWVDDFSKARNYALSLANTNWVISVDSDEVLFEEDSRKIRKFAKEFTNYPHPLAIAIATMNKIGDVFHRSNELRMFKNNGAIEWKNRIHEMPVIKSNPKQSLRIINSDIRFFHDGYDIENNSKGLQRNIRLLQMSVEEEPENLLMRYLLGRDLLGANRVVESISQLEYAEQLSLVETEHPMRPELYRTLVTAYERANLLDKAIEKSEEMMHLFPSYPDGFFQHGVLTMQKMSREIAIAQNDVLQSKQLSSNYHGAAYSESEIASWRSDVVLADIKRLIGDWNAARRLYKSALNAVPNSVDVQSALSRLESQISAIANK